MVKGFVFAAAAGLTLAASALTAQAMPVPADLGQDSLVTNVAEGCGRGWERNRFGECRPMRGRRDYDRRPAIVVRPPVVVAPRVVAPRRCVTRVTPYGVREICR